MFLKFVYTLFIGILLATFIGVGIAAFYPQPKSPEYPAMLSYPIKTEPPSTNSTESATVREQQQFDKLQKAFQEQSDQYNRNVSIIALIASLLILAVSLVLLKNIVLISGGVLLGGVLTLIYSIIRGFSTDDNMFRFIVVSIGLAISLFLGYIKIVKPDSTKKS